MRLCIFILFLFVVVINRCWGKIYMPCDLARELLIVHRIPRNELNHWLCLSYGPGEAFFNTSAIYKLNNDGSSDHGLFQINDRHWCNEPIPGKGCNVSCREVRTNDIRVALTCARLIHRTKGFDAWVNWRRKCKGQNLSKYSALCKL